MMQTPWGQRTCVVCHFFLLVSWRNNCSGFPDDATQDLYRSKADLAERVLFTRWSLLQVSTSYKTRVFHNQDLIPHYRIIACLWKCLDNRLGEDRLWWYSWRIGVESSRKVWEDKPCSLGLLAPFQYIKQFTRQDHSHSEIVMYLHISWLAN